MNVIVVSLDTAPIRVMLTEADTVVTLSIDSSIIFEVFEHEAE